MVYQFTSSRLLDVYELHIVEDVLDSGASNQKALGERPLVSLHLGVLAGPWYVVCAYKTNV